MQDYCFYRPIKIALPALNQRPPSLLPEQKESTMNERSSNTTPRPTTTERPQAGSPQRGEVPRRAAGTQRTQPATARSRSDARHATRVAADDEVLIVGV
jgi:hypothetical protein